MENELTNKILVSLQIKAEPRDKNVWIQRLKEEYQELITIPLTYLTTTSEIVVPELDVWAMTFDRNTWTYTKRSSSA
ncbi:Ubiquitin-fold modifier-conjugating enzyme 1 [Vespula squamosa]|uniref:Ufm1-conjugating enzyme 1 n=1 Tax=Vespula squamosa TaxID=30214 RepID=A0ABD2A6Y2_VESSQ